MSYLPRLLRDIRQLNALLRDLSTCPLGAAASFGTSWPIDRPRTAALLGFKYPTPSGADGIWCRGELEGRFASIAAQYLAHLSGIAQDVILLSSPPRTWLRLADEHVTGSSIMPQKRNPDFAEVTRARANVAAGIAQSLGGIAVALPSGYNRDTQWTKYLVFDAADNVENASELYADVFRRMKVNAPAMREDCGLGFLNATDVADLLSRTRKVPFRDCYRILGAAVRSCDAEGKLTHEKINAVLREHQVAELSAEEWAKLDDPVGLLEARSQPGNPNPEETLRSIDLLESEIIEEAKEVATKAAFWRAAIHQLFGTLGELAAKSGR